MATHESTMASQGPTTGVSFAEGDRLALRGPIANARGQLQLTPGELLSTTRAVRRRLDLTRPVDREVLEECLELAQQAPTARFAQDWHFLVVTDPELRAALGELWRTSGERYLEHRSAGSALGDRVRASVWHLIDHIHEVPVHVIPCIEGRTDGNPSWQQASRWGSVIPAAWSFMLAARARGLGTAWTTFHLAFEREAAQLLGIPYDDVMQAALIPVAYTSGTDFKPGRREPLDGALGPLEGKEPHVSVKDAEPIVVEVLSFEGCPNAEPALEAVQKAASATGVEIDLRPVDIPDLDTAERNRFLGSPSIRISGRDVEAEADHRDDYVFGCRVYRTANGTAGVPPREWIERALRQAAGSGG